MNSHSDCPFIILPFFIIFDSLFCTEIVPLDWMTDNSKYVIDHLIETNLIIGADIIYDNSLFNDLLTTVKCLFDHCTNLTEFLLMNAVRNVETEKEFLGLLGKVLYNFTNCSISYHYWAPFLKMSV